MPPLTLVRNQRDCGRMNLSGLLPEQFVELTVEQLQQWPVLTDAGEKSLADIAEVSDGARDQLLLVGDWTSADYVAAGMNHGAIIIQGSLGNFLAAGMRGGRVEIHGDAGDYACSSMAGGRVVIQGSVGRYAAAAAPLAPRGMSGGELWIGGSADEFLASRMRRGRVVVLGDVAAGCASRMIAGTVVIAGKMQLPSGYGMARGTLLLLNPSPALLDRGLPGFTTLEPCELSFLPILLNDVARSLPAEVAQHLAGARWLRAVGDRAEQGLGELLVRELAQPPEL